MMMKKKETKWWGIFVCYFILFIYFFPTHMNFGLESSDWCSFLYTHSLNKQTHFHWEDWYCACCQWRKYTVKNTLFCLQPSKESRQRLEYKYQCYIYLYLEIFISKRYTGEKTPAAPNVYVYFVNGFLNSYKQTQYNRAAKLQSTVKIVLGVYRYLKK